MSSQGKIAAHRVSCEDIRKSRELRNQASFVERKLWRCLSSCSKALSIRFRRQHPIHPYIVDFVCLAAQLIIEVDGPSHDAAQAYDEQREIFLRKAGFQVIRFSNEDVCENVDGVVSSIIEEAQKWMRLQSAKMKDPHPNPPLKGEGT